MLQSRTKPPVETAQPSIDGESLRLWADDDVSPASRLFSYKANVVLVWDATRTLRRFSANEALVFLHESERFWICREVGEFFHETACNAKEAVDRVFTSAREDESVAAVQALFGTPYLEGLASEEYISCRDGVDEGTAAGEELSRAALLANSDRVLKE